MRRPYAAPLAFIAAALLAIVVWAILPRQHPNPKHRARAAPVALATPARTPAPTASAAPAPITSTSPAATAAPAVNPNGPRVAIIIDDCGQWLATERAIVGLPIALTLSVLPHVRYSAEIAQEAAGAGKGVMLHVPMEPISHINPGPGEIKTAMSDRAIDAQMEDDVAQVPLAKGMNNHEGSEASADVRVMNDVVAIAKEHGMFFIDSRTSSTSVAERQARDAGVPTASRDVFLDNRADVAYTESMLEQTVAVAKRDGSAIAIGHPKPTTLAALRAMYPRMQAEGVRFVLASDIVR